MRFVTLSFVLVALLMIGVPAQAANIGVTVGSSSLIDVLDYSDTYTGTDAGGIDDRPWGAFPPGVQDYPANGIPGEGLNVENYFGNPQPQWPDYYFSPPRQWPDARWSINADDNVIGGVPYPGTSGAGSDTGMTQTGGTADWSVEYGLRDNFVVQMDAVQAYDRIDIWISATDSFFDPQALAVFFRGSDYAGTWPGIGIFHGSEYDSGLTPIVPMGEWHNFAVHFKLGENKLEVFTDEISLGEVDLTAILPDTDFSNARVGVGGNTGGGANWVMWTDNFQVGVPEPATIVLLGLGGLVLSRRRKA